MITPKELADYLRRTQLLTDEAIVTDGVSIANTSRRNHNFSVVQPNGPSYFVKQGIGPDGESTIAREAAVYRLLGPSLEACGGDDPTSFLPTLVRFDDERSLLVLDFVRAARSLSRHCYAVGRFSAALPTEMGRILATLHGPALSGISAPDADPPWATALHVPRLEAVQTVSVANVQLIKILQQHDAYCASLEEIGKTWRPSAFVHFDVKFDNWLVAGPVQVGRQRRLKLIDWELGGKGDPCWDIGSIFASYLDFWVSSIPIISDVPAHRFPALARYQLTGMQPATLAFWTTYTKSMGLSPEAMENWLVRSMRYTAVRLLQTAFESSQQSLQLSGSAIFLLQLSQNILSRPREAAAQLLGLALPAATIVGIPDA